MQLLHGAVFNIAVRWLAHLHGIMFSQDDPHKAQGVKFYMISQSEHGSLQPELYRSGSVALAMGVEAGCDTAIALRARFCHDLIAATLHEMAILAWCCVLHIIYVRCDDAGRKCRRSAQI